ncbi:MAG: glycosyltransferase family 2 protein, partial [Chloroflexota bacterium]
LLRDRVPRLLADGLRRSGRARALAFDAAAEQVIPPLSVPFALGTLCLGAGLLLGDGLPVTLAALSLGGQVTHLLAAMALVGAPWKAYLALAYAPAYIAWKVGLYARALVVAPSTRWIRTARTAGSA